MRQVPDLFGCEVVAGFHRTVTPGKLREKGRVLKPPFQTEVSMKKILLAGAELVGGFLQFGGRHVVKLQLRRILSSSQVLETRMAHGWP